MPPEFESKRMMERLLLLCLIATTGIVALITGTVEPEAIPLTIAIYTILEAIEW